MPSSSLVLIRENPSLAAGLTDLFEAEGYRVSLARDLSEATRLLTGGPSLAPPILVVASNGHFSPAVCGWREGQLSDLYLVVVGSRDPHLSSRGRLHVVHLPLDIPAFLELILDLSAPVVQEPALQAVDAS